MTALGLAIGHIVSFILITVLEWLWILGFLVLVEEKELLGKFGEEYVTYQHHVPMLVANPTCLFKVFSSSVTEP